MTPKRVAIFLAALIAALFLTGAITLVVNDTSQDSGVKACEQMIKNIEKGNPSSVQIRSSDADYEKARKPYEDSKYDDLRDAGTKFVDSVKQLDRAVDRDDGSAWDPLIKSKQYHDELRAACAQHGAYVPHLPTP
jgi:hypothetical protein